MSKDIEPKIDLETRFTALKDELVKRIGMTYQEHLQHHSGVVIRVLTNERDGGSQALMLGSDGKWGGKMDMIGYDIGESPDTDILIREFAAIKDEAYQAIQFLADDDKGEATREQYLQQNRERLLQGLVTEMEARLQELRNSKEE